MKTARDLWLATLPALLLIASCRPEGLCLGAESSGWLAESTLAGLPPEAQDVVRAQVARYLGMVDLAGVPLLDPAVDWNVLANWPGKFVYQGRTNHLSLLHYGLDICVYPRSTSKDLQPFDLEVSATYKSKLPAGATGIDLVPHVSWRSDDNTGNPRWRIAGVTNACAKSLRATERGVKEDLVFAIHLYRSGRLFKLRWNPPNLGEHTEVYDPNGKRIGLSIAEQDARSKKWKTKCEWRGKPVHSRVFEQLSHELASSEIPSGTVTR